MRYEHEVEGEAGYEGFAISGTWDDNARLTTTLDELASEHQGNVSRYSPAQKRITSYWHEMAKMFNERKEACPYPDFFLLTQPDSKDTNAEQEYILVGVHEQCMYKNDDFIGIALNLGLRETRRTSGKLLHELVETATEPYDAPCIYAKKSLESKGYKVARP